MRPNNRGQATIGEILLILFLLLAFAGAGWYILSKKTESNTFHDQSKQVVHNHYYVTRNYSLLDFVFSPFNFGGCARRPDSIDDGTAQDINEVNSVVNTDKE